MSALRPLRIGHVAPVATTIPPSKSGSVEAMTSLLTEAPAFGEAGVPLSAVDATELPSDRKRVWTKDDARRSIPTPKSGYAGLPRSGQFVGDHRWSGYGHAP